MKYRYLLLVLVGLAFSCEQGEERVLTEKQPEVSIGDILHIDSEILGEEREIWVHVPTGFYGMNEQVAAYPVVYLMDGEIHFKSTVGILDQMANAANATDLTPQMIVVGITNSNRVKDLTPTPAVIGRDSSTLENTGGAGLMADFIAEELIPYIEEKYPVAPYRTLIGHSFGGLFVLNTLINRPDLFANYLVIDPGMWYDDERFSHSVLAKMERTSFSQQQVYIAIANNMLPGMQLAEVYADTSELLSQMGSIMRFRDRLDSISLERLEIQMKYYPQENHGQLPLLATYEGMRSFFADFSFTKMITYYHPDTQEGATDIVPAIDAHYAKLSAQMGYPVIPQESYINAYAYGLYRFGKHDVAKSLFDLNRRNYPTSANAYLALGNYYAWELDTVQAIVHYEQSLAINENQGVRELLHALKN